MHSHGTALQWHLNYMKSKFQIYPDWPQYIVDLTLRFGEAYSDPLAELSAVKQKGTAQKYVDAFELALTQVNLSPQHILGIFLAGLEKPIQMQVRIFNPTSMSPAKNLARLFEVSQSPKWNSSQHYNPYNLKQNSQTLPLHLDRLA